jgi:uncharacterized protein YkwD
LTAWLAIILFPTTVLPPIAGRGSPAERARAAGYKGSFAGENIYQGGGGPESAYRAWWTSDGHRIIMFASRPDRLGIAFASGFWTLNTGGGA